MKESEFIELLNLYLDHEISAADAARLEAEVQANPARRRIYRDYCQMQKACKVLAEEFRGEPVVVPQGKVIDFSTARPRSEKGNFYVAGAVAAAAACVAIVFVGENRQQLPSTSGNEMIVAAPAVPTENAATATSLPARTEVPAARLVRQTEPRRNGPLMTDTVFLRDSAQSDAILRDAAEQAASHFAWMEQVQLAPVQHRLSQPELRFEARPPSLRTEARTFTNRQQAVDATVEMTAFQFQR